MTTTPAFDNLRPAVAQILEMEDDPYSWVITDTLTYPDSDEVHLVMVNYTKDADLFQYGDLRGTMVDIPNEMIYGRSRGYTDTAVANELELNTEDMIQPELSPDYVDYLVSKRGLDPDYVATQSGRVKALSAIVLPTSSDLGLVQVEYLNMQPLFDGVVIRVLLVDGKVILATHKKFNPTRSHWEHSKNFQEIFEEMGLPSESLYSEHADFSPVVHAFLLNAPALRVASKYPGGPMAIYLGSMETWSKDDSPFPVDQVDFEIREPEGMVDEVDLNATEPYIYSPTKSMTLEEANQHLMWSWEKPCEDAELMDLRTFPGGGLMVYLPSGETLKVVSKSWEWRENLRLNTSNLALAVYKARDWIKDPTEYKRVFPFLESRPLKVLMVNAGRIVCWPTVDSPPETSWQMTTNVLNNYVLAVPFDRQKEILELRKNVNQDIGRLANFMLGFIPNQAQKPRRERGKQQLTWTQKIKQDLEDYDDRAVERLIKILGFVMASTRDADDQQLEVARKAKIREALDREAGASLYRLVRMMKKVHDSQVP